MFQGKDVLVDCTNKKEDGKTCEAQLTVDQFEKVFYNQYQKNFT